MKWKNLILEREDKVATLYINRPEALNALNIELLQQLSQALDIIKDDSEIKVLIITGSGDKAFISGADIEFMVDMTPEEAQEFSALGQNLFLKLEEFEKPVIAAVNGFALGGGLELAIACDFIYASEKAKLGQPEINLGIIPGFGGTQRLPRLIGINLAKELIYTGKVLKAIEAKAVGLINEVFPPGELLPETIKTARMIVTKGSFSLKAAKKSINGGDALDIKGGGLIERDGFALCFSCPDQKEGMKAFLEKRKPNFS